MFYNLVHLTFQSRRTEEWHSIRRNILRLRLSPVVLKITYVGLNCIINTTSFAIRIFATVAAILHRRIIGTIDHGDYDDDYSQ